MIETKLGPFFIYTTKGMQHNYYSMKCKFPLQKWGVLPFVLTDCFFTQL